MATRRGDIGVGVPRIPVVGVRADRSRVCATATGAIGRELGGRYPGWHRPGLVGAGVIESLKILNAPRDVLDHDTSVTSLGGGLGNTGDTGCAVPRSTCGCSCLCR